MLTNRDIALRYMGAYAKPEMTNKEISDWFGQHQQCHTCPARLVCDEEDQSLLCEQVVERWLNDGC
jgi:hypothetical protein